MIARRRAGPARTEGRDAVMVSRVVLVPIVVTLSVLAVFAPMEMAAAESAWAMLEPDDPRQDSGVLAHLWHHWRHGGGYVVNHFFATAEACKKLEARWMAEAGQILAKKNSELREALLAGHLMNSKCVPAAALPLFKVRPGASFQP